MLVAIALAGFAFNHSWQMFTHYDPNKGIVETIAKLNDLSGKLSAPHSVLQGAYRLPVSEPSPQGITFDIALLTMAASLFMRAAGLASPMWSQRCNKVMWVGFGLILLSAVLSFLV